jgi:small subunit ribosomal protein S9
VTDAEHPEDEQARDQEQPAAAEPRESELAPSEPASEQPAAAEEPPPAEPASEQPAAAEEPPSAEPVAETPAPVAETPAPVVETPAPVAETPAPVAEAPAPAAETPAPAAETPTPPAETPAASQPEGAEEEVEEVEIAPLEKPEIPGADLIPDIVQEGDGFLDAEAEAAAEAEAEAAAAREQEPEDEARPIAEAVIDLAAGARYTATGKRKTAVARVILKPGSGTYLINGKTLDEFFPRDTLRRVIRQPLETVGYEARVDVVAAMHGGGVAAQAGALRHGISRALIVADTNLRGELKRRGFLTRDPRVKERKKAGLKKARKRPQFSKR